ncbi:MAG: hypothetical protein IS632_00810 [Thaumarchaeota archaeon]|nr:hypothetical protein [Nitrososphaerota archaeon]
MRKDTAHHFLRAALIAKNQDKPDRPTNSGKTAYQIGGEVLKLIRSYGTAGRGTATVEPAGAPVPAHCAAAQLLPLWPGRGSPGRP